MEAQEWVLQDRSCLILFAEQSMGLMYLGLILRGMGVACISATKFGMIADSIEYGEYKTGTRAEGFVYFRCIFRGPRWFCSCVCSYWLGVGSLWI